MSRALSRLALLLCFLGLVLLAGATGGCGGAPPAPAAPASIFPAGTVERMSRGVFEVIAPQLDDGSITYAEPLPVDLLPYAQRIDKFVAVGTAFAISSRRFITAAHVMKAYEATTHDHYLLRDSAGVTYEIGKIVRYSQYRDLVELELVSPPPTVVPLEVRTHPEIGEVVNSVGNAGGEGIVIRTGSITSFTPEPLEGAWRNIRFTAPASPGNSGGPLVDSAGRVIGVVVQKSEAENLNVAVPIEEVEKLSTAASEFYLKGIAVGESGHQEYADWHFASPLPATFADVRKAAEADLEAMFARRFAAYDASHAAQSFPGDPKLREFVRTTRGGEHFGLYTRDSGGGWALREQTYEARELDGGTEVQLHEESDRKSGEIFFNKAPAVPSAVFFKHPTLVADYLVHKYGWSVVFAGRPIAIATLGAPAEDERWSDTFGRHWRTYVWRILRSGESLVLSCLTRPTGWACRWRKAPLAQEALVRRYSKRIAPRTTLNYFGSVADWEQYLALPRGYRPRVLEGAKVHLGAELAVTLGPLSGSFAIAGLTKASRLQVLVGIHPAAMTAERVYNAAIVPERAVDRLFGVNELLEPAAGSSAESVDAWKKSGAQQAPYDGTTTASGKAHATMGLLEAATASGSRLTFYCRAPGDEKKAALETACAQFRAELRLPPQKPETP